MTITEDGGREGYIYPAYLLVYFLGLFLLSFFCSHMVSGVDRWICMRTYIHTYRSDVGVFGEQREKVRGLVHIKFPVHLFHFFPLYIRDLKPLSENHSPFVSFFD